MRRGVTLIEYCASAAHDQLRQIVDAVIRLRVEPHDPQHLVATLMGFPFIALTEADVREAVSHLLTQDDALAPPSGWLRMLYRAFGVLEDESQTDPEDAVLVTTLHSAKGLGRS